MKTLAKFCVLVDGDDLPHDYGNLFFEEPSGNRTRLVIGPTAGHVDLMLELARELQGHPWYALYVHLVPRGPEFEAGRYESKPFDSFDDLQRLFTSYRDLFESDGRHHVWIGSPSDNGTLVYDQHNVLFAYGPIDRYRQKLVEHGFREESFWFPAPHSHHYWPENDPEVRRLMSEMQWTLSPLRDQDEWK